MPPSSTVQDVLNTGRISLGVLDRVEPPPYTVLLNNASVSVLRGSEEACAYYRLLLEELRERVRTGIAAVPGERFRLYWDGMPIWGKLRDLSRLLERRATAVVASTYCNSWIFDALDPRDPFRSLARASLELFIARAKGPKERYIERMVGSVHFQRPWSMA